jgi:hypothetical protein
MTGPGIPPPTPHTPHTPHTRSEAGDRPPTWATDAADDQVDAPPKAPPPWAQRVDRPDDDGQPTWAVGPEERPAERPAERVAERPAERVAERPALPDDGPPVWARAAEQEREQRWGRVRRGRRDRGDRVDREGAGGWPREERDRWDDGGEHPTRLSRPSRLTTAPARLGIVLGMLLYVLAAYWAFTPLEVPSSQGPPFRCGTALSHPADTFGRSVCGQINNRAALRAGAAALAGVIVIVGGFFVVTAPREGR